MNCSLDKLNGGRKGGMGNVVVYLYDGCSVVQSPPKVLRPPRLRGRKPLPLFLPGGSRYFIIVSEPCVDAGTQIPTWNLVLCPSCDPPGRKRGSGLRPLNLGGLRTFGGDCMYILCHRWSRVSKRHTVSCCRNRSTAGSNTLTMV